MSEESTKTEARISPESKDKIISSIYTNLKDILTKDNEQFTNSEKWTRADLYKVIDHTMIVDKFDPELVDHINNVLMTDKKESHINDIGELSRIFNEIEPEIFSDIDNIIESTREEIKDEWVVECREILKNLPPEEWIETAKDSEKAFNNLGYSFQLEPDGNVIVERIVEQDNSFDNQSNTDDSPESNIDDSPESNTDDSSESNTNDSPESNTDDSPESNTDDSPESNTDDSPESNTGDSPKKQGNPKDKTVQASANPADEGKASMALGYGIDAIGKGIGGVLKPFKTIGMFGAKAFLNTMPTKEKRAEYKNLSRYTARLSNELHESSDRIEEGIDAIATKKDMQGNDLSNEQIDDIKEITNGHIEHYEEHHKLLSNALKDNLKKIKKNDAKDINEALDSHDQITDALKRHEGNKDIKEISERMNDIIKKIMEALAKLFSMKKDSGSSPSM